MTKFYVLIGFINLLDLIAVISGRLWSNTGKPIYLWVCVAGFALAGYFFAHSLKYEGTAVVNVLWIALSVVLVTIISYFFFKESISAWQLAGIVTVIVGIVFLNIK